METIQPNKTKTINNYDVLDCDKNGRFQCPKVYNWFFIIWAISRLVFISIIWCCFAILCDLFGYEVLLVNRGNQGSPLAPSYQNLIREGFGEPQVP